MFFLRASCTVIASILALASAANNHTQAPGHTQEPTHHHEPTLPGKCPEFPPFASLDVSKITGDWYGAGCLRKGLGDDHDHVHVVKCMKKTIVARSDGSLEANLSMKKDSEWKNKTVVANPIKDKEAQFTLVKDSKEDIVKEMKLTIIDTDNSGYLISAVCLADAEKHGYIYQLFSRSKTPPPGDVEKAKAVLKKMNINDELVPVEQNC